MILKGVFTAGELRLMITAMAGAEMSPMLAGQYLPINSASAVLLDEIDKTYNVEFDNLNQKLLRMSTPELMILEIWIQGFWQSVANHGQDLDEYIQVAL
jgi:hypothetical protein